MRAFWSKVKATLSRRRREQDLHEEIRFHIEMLVEEGVARGMSATEARLAARREFGGAEQIKEVYRDRRGFSALDSFLQDIRFAFRLLGRDRRFTAVAALTLALGIGATTALFAIVERAVLSPLPFPAADRLVAIESAYRTSDATFTSAPGVFFDWRERSESFERMAGIAGTVEFTWSRPDAPRNVRVLRVSQDFFDVTGMPFLQGRPWTSQEDAPAGPLGAIVTEKLRQDMEDGQPVIGRRIRLNEGEYTIVGVVPTGFRLGKTRDPEVFVPLQANQRSRTGGPVNTIGRLREGVALETARAEMDAITTAIRAESPVDDIRAVVTPLDDWVVGDVRLVLLTVLGAVSCIWLIGCANLANMQLARNAARVKELAVRASLGAGRLRLMRQLLIETTVTASLGGVLGLGFSYVVLRSLPAIQAIYVPRVEEIDVSSLVLAFAALLTVLSGLLVGLAPAIQAGRNNLNSALTGGNVLFGQSGGRLRAVLVTSQLALSVVLLAGAGLLANSFVRLLNIDLGFERSDIAVVRPNLPQMEPDAAVRFFAQLRDVLVDVPQVESAAVTNLTPLEAVHTPLYLKIDPEQQETVEANARQVTPDYFDLLRIPLQAGRGIAPGDADRQPVPAVLSRSAVRLLFGDSNPLGRRIHNPMYRSMTELEVVGVAAEVRQFGVRQEPSPIVYLPVGLHFAPRYVIARLAPGAPIPTTAIRDIVREMNPAITVDITTMDSRFADETSEARFYFWLLSGSALAGLLIAAVGVYGVMSYAVAHRTREFAIRIAMGARKGQILWQAVGSAVWMTAAGLALGLFGAAAATRLLESLLYQVEPDDPATLAAVAALLCTIALAAASLAGRRATSISPVAALKQE